MKKKNFIKVKENFVCENCGKEVQGTGYTNHCPYCLFSKHVDQDTPGDRLGECQGLMQPKYIDTKNGKHVVVHECQKCGKEMRNKTSENDNIDEIIRVSGLPRLPRA